LQNNENRYYKKKSEIINQLADKLSQIPGIELHKISAIITQELEGIVSPRYIREALPPEYKNENQSNRVKGRDKSGGANPCRNEFEPEKESDAGFAEPNTAKFRLKPEFGYYHIEPKEYLIEDLSQYTTDLKDGIIKYLDNENRRLMNDTAKFDGQFKKAEEVLKDLKRRKAEIEARQTCN
jgi:hypothetical protein